METIYRTCYPEAPRFNRCLLCLRETNLQLMWCKFIRAWSRSINTMPGTISSVCNVKQSSLLELLYGSQGEAQTLKLCQAHDWHEPNIYSHYFCFFVSCKDNHFTGCWLNIGHGGMTAYNAIVCISEYIWRKCRALLTKARISEDAPKAVNVILSDWSAKPRRKETTWRWSILVSCWVVD